MEVCEAYRYLTTIIEINLKASTAKCRPLRSYLNVLTNQGWVTRKWVVLLRKKMIQPAACSCQIVIKNAGSLRITEFKTKFIEIRIKIEQIKADATYY